LSTDSLSLKDKLHPDSFPFVVQLPSIAEGNKNLSANQLVNIANKTGPFRDAASDLNVKVSFISSKLINFLVLLEKPYFYFRQRSDCENCEDSKSAAPHL